MNSTQKSIKAALIIATLTAFPNAQAERQLISLNSTVGDQIPALISIPDDQKKYPACVVFHGSGGLFKEDEPGQNCTSELENNYELLFQRLEQLGVAIIAPDSFGRDSRFCEDNDNAYFQFVPPPFHNPGDGELNRESDGYKTRRILTRSLDGLAAIDYLSSHPQVDSDNICLIGTSNGGSTAMSLSTVNPIRHLSAYADKSQARPTDTQNDFDTRAAALANFPVIDLTEYDQLPAIPLFTHAISPGCFLKKLVPTRFTDEINAVNWPEDYFYPQTPTQNHPKGHFLNIDIGSLDNVPAHCRETGVRGLQVDAYQQAHQLSTQRWLLESHEGFDHDLLADNPDIIEKTEALVIKHFYTIFENSFD